MSKKDERREDAREELRKRVKPGDTVYTIVRHVSRSGMSRVIGVVLLGSEGPLHPNYLVARALGVRVHPKLDGVVIGGCGMDMGFHLVYELSHALFPTGYGCLGVGCHSNDHSNGDRDFTPHGCFDAEGRPEDRAPSPGEKADGCKRHWHRDGGYALKQRWL